MPEASASGERVETEILVRFGVVTDEQLARLRNWLTTDPTLLPQPPPLLTGLSQLHLRDAWEYDCEALGHFLWLNLGLHRITSDALRGVPHRVRVARLIEIMVLNRLAQPMSKWGILTDWLEDSATPFLVGPPLASLNNNTFYRALDHLWTHQDALEVKVWREVVRPLTPHPEVFFHDNTNTWFEGVPADLGAFSGYAPDHRTDRPRVKWGAVDPEEGFPVTLAVFPGNTKDDQTPRTMRDRLTRVLGLDGGTYVGDRGIKRDDGAKDLENDGFDWILAVRNDQNE